MTTELDATRRRFEDRLGAVRTSLAGELGVRPKKRGWWILLLAAAIGLTLGAGARQRSRGRRPAAQ